MENKSAIERAREYGIDISLLESSLKLTIEQRMQRLQEWMVFSEKLSYAKHKLYPQLKPHDATREGSSHSPK